MSNFYATDFATVHKPPSIPHFFNETPERPAMSLFRPYQVLPFRRFGNNGPSHTGDSPGCYRPHLQGGWKFLRSICSIFALVSVEHGVFSKNRGYHPPNHPLKNRVFSIFFTIHFGVSLIFGSTQNGGMVEKHQWKIGKNGASILPIACTKIVFLLE